MEHSVSVHGKLPVWPKGQQKWDRIMGYGNFKWAYDFLDELKSLIFI